MKSLKVPSEIINGQSSQNALSLNGCSVIEQCIHSMEVSGTMNLEEHLLLFVLDGSVKLTYGKQIYEVHKNEMILLKKATSVHYEKTGNPDNDNIYDSLMFFIKDDLLSTFFTQNDVKIPKMEGEVKVTVNAMNDCLVAFAESVKPYFNATETVLKGQLRLKVMELLYDVTIVSRNMFLQLVQLHQPQRINISGVVENNYTNPITIEQMAYLSGRSLSSFKRDFKLTYNTTPAAWIRNKRLEKSQEMLKNTNLSVAEICFSVGFENPSHFSRIYKNHFGMPPTGYQV